MNQGRASDKSSLFMLALAMVIVRCVAGNSLSGTGSLRLNGRVLPEFVLAH